MDAEVCSAMNTTLEMSGEGGSDSLIPIIDISRIDERTGELAVAAAAEYGFLFVKGDDLGFSKEMVDHAFSVVRLIQACAILVSSRHACLMHRLQSQRFFASPVQEKEQCAIQSNVVTFMSILLEIPNNDAERIEDWLVIHAF